MDCPEIDTPEVFYKKDVMYSFTYNPSDKWQYFGESDRYAKCRAHFYSLLLPLSPNCIQYKMVMELSEPRKGNHGYSGPRYHIHGWFKFSHVKGIYWFLEQYLYTVSRTGLYDIDTVSDELHWNKYMTKQAHIYGKRNVSFMSSVEMDPNSE